jgi:hypothetical protein
MNFDVEIWVAMASAVIAICALGVTIWQGRQNYKHNKLSVRPFLGTFEYRDIINNNTGRLTFELMNCGIGPAIIKNFVLFYDGKEVSRNNRKTYYAFLQNLLADFGRLEISMYSPGAAMQIGEKLLLLSFDYDFKKQDIGFTNKLNLIVDYQSIYENKVFTYDSKRDRLFHGEILSK